MNGAPALDPQKGAPFEGVKGQICPAFLPSLYLYKLCLMTLTYSKPPSVVLVVGKLQTSPTPKMFSNLLCYKVS